MFQFIFRGTGKNPYESCSKAEVKAREVLWATSKRGEPQLFSNSSDVKLALG